jgi:hypothetical protein
MYASLKCQCFFNYLIAYSILSEPIFLLALHLLTDKPVCAKRMPPILYREHGDGESSQKDPQIISLWQCVVMGEMSRGEITYV